MVRALTHGQFSRRSTRVHRHDRGRRETPKDLDRVLAQTSDAHHERRPLTRHGIEVGGHGVVRRQAGVGQRGELLCRQPLRLDQEPFGGNQHELGQSPVTPEPATHRAGESQAGALPSDRTSPALPAGPDAVHRDRLVQPVGGDSGADAGDRTGHLVTQSEGEREGKSSGAVHDVQVRVAQARGIDTEQELARTRRRHGNLDELRLPAPRDEA